MTYVPTYERKARAEGKVEGIALGLQDGIALALKLKFSAAGEGLMTEIRQLNDPAVLRLIMQAIEKSNSVDEVRSAWVK